MEIDADCRRLHARVHSAGHLLDSALFFLGMTDLQPSKVSVCECVCSAELLYIISTCIYIIIHT